MKFISVETSGRVAAPANLCVEIRAKFEAPDGMFVLDCHDVIAALEEVVPFQVRRLDGHMSVNVSPADLSEMLLTQAAKKGLDTVIVGSRDGLSFSLGMDGLASAWLAAGTDRDDIWSGDSGELVGTLPPGATHAVLRVTITTMEGSREWTRQAYPVPPASAMRTAAAAIASALSRLKEAH